VRLTAQRARGYPSPIGRVLGSYKIARIELENPRAAANAELDDARTATDARAVLKSELEQEYAALEEERKCTTDLEGHLAFLELEVESSARGSDTTVQLEEHVLGLERELSDVAAEVEPVRAGADSQKAEHARFEQEETRWVQVADGIKNEWARWEQEHRSTRNSPSRQRTTWRSRQAGCAHLYNASTSRSSCASLVWLSSSTLFVGTSRNRLRALRSPSSCSQRKSRREQPFFFFFSLVFRSDVSGLIELAGDRQR
jgi:hypothetical protein